MGKKMWSLRASIHSRIKIFYSCQTGLIKIVQTNLFADLQTAKTQK